MKNNLNEEAFIMNNIDKKADNKEKKQLGIYIHIPFCVRKCDYCDFLSGPATRETQQRYVNALIEEINSYKNQYADYEVETVFIGGGTPSVLEGRDIIRIMDVLYNSFNVPNNQEQMELTIECNPGTITKDKLFAYKEAKINRISFGLQSTNNEELAILGRIHTYEEFYNNYQLAREVGFDNINIDLMSALPGQQLEDWENTLNRIITLQPEHISAYSLIIEEGTPYYNIYGEGKTHLNPSKFIPYELPDEDTERLIFQRTKEILESNYYYSYEISNYSKRGYECKHNSSYWNRIDYLGLGLGASSLIANIRHHNTEDITHYIEHSKNSNIIREDIHPLSIKEQMEEFMFLGLRLTQGISKQKFYNGYKRSIHEVYGAPLSKLITENLIKETENYIYLTNKGIDLSNYVLAEFLL